jgi:hypothetical protein
MSLLAALSAADPDVVPESSCEDCEGFFPKSCPIRLFTSSTHLHFLYITYIIYINVSCIRNMIYI